MKKLLISICNKQQNITVQIKDKYDKKALFEAKDIEEIEKMLNETQEQFNQFLIQDSIAGNSHFNSVEFSYGGGAPSAIERGTRQNLLMKMIERYEGYSISN